MPEVGIAKNRFEYLMWFCDGCHAVFPGYKISGSGVTCQRVFILDGQGFFPGIFLVLVASFTSALILRPTVNAFLNQGQIGAMTFMVDE